MSDIIVKCVCQHCQRVTVVPQETIRTLLSEAEQREKDARAKALEEAAKVVDEITEKQKKAWDDHIESGANGPATSFYPVFEKVASDIRALQSEERQ